MPQQCNRSARCVPRLSAALERDAFHSNSNLGPHFSAIVPMASTQSSQLMSISGPP